MTIFSRIKYHFILLFCLIHFDLDALPNKINFETLNSFEVSINALIRSYPEMSQEFIADFKIIKKENQYFAVSETPSYIGTIKEAPWQQLISDSILQELDAFLRILDSIPFEPNEPSYVTDGYILKYNNKTYEVTQGYCFSSLSNDLKLTRKTFILDIYQSIFSNQINTLNSKRLAHKAQIEELIARKWYFNPEEHQELKEKDILTFSTSSDKQKTAHWTINKSFHFKHSLRKDPESDAKIVIEYDLYSINQKNMFLAVYGINQIVGRSDTQKWEQTSFYILELNEKELVLQVTY